jgi:hypothetical protein
MATPADLAARIHDKSPEDRERALRLFEGRCAQFPAGANRVAMAASGAAIALQMWIVARQTNARSLAYVGRSGYVAKPMSCKPKTADRHGVARGGSGGESLCAGLVVDPTRFGPEIFVSSRKREKAMEAWTHIPRDSKGNLDRGYSLDERPGSRRFGCLLLNGCYIYGDLDLFDVIKASKPINNMIREEKIGPDISLDNEYVRLARNAINDRAKVEIVLHGGHTAFGSFEDERLDVFPPDPARLPFTLSDAFAARAWYALRWPGRVPVGVLDHRTKADWLFQQPQPWQKRV